MKPFLELIIGLLHYLKDISTLESRDKYIFWKGWRANLKPTNHLKNQNKLDSN